MNDEYLESLLMEAHRILATDLYPVRCRTVIAKLATALRAMAADLQEARDYGVAMEEELKARAEKPPVEVRFTWAEGDQEFWLHMKLPDGKAAGINLGNPKTMIATAALRALVSRRPPSPP